MGRRTICSLLFARLSKFLACKEGLIETFYHSVSHMVVWCGPKLLYSCKRTEFLDNTIFKITFLIIMLSGMRNIYIQKQELSTAYT